MIIASGIDIVSIDRFSSWRKFNKSRLLKIFNSIEIDYCYNSSSLKLACLAARFSAKESAYKAFSSLIVQLNLNIKISFMAFCKFLYIMNHPRTGVPLVYFDSLALSNYLGFDLPDFKFEVSISHEKQYAISSVLIIL